MLRPCLPRCRSSGMVDYFEVVMMELEFYDVKARAKFKSKLFDIQEKESKGVKRFFAVAKSPTGKYPCWRVLSTEQAKELVDNCF